MNAEYIPGTHDGQTIASVLTACLASWNIPVNRIHVLVRDNAGNMRVSGGVMGINSEPCFLHTLQLAINDVIKPSFSSSLKIARDCVSFFSMSPKATGHFRELQVELNIAPVHKYSRTSQQDGILRSPF